MVAYMEFQGPGFVMEVPTNWLVTSSAQYQTMFLSPQGKDSLRANLILTIRPVNEDVTTGEAAQQAGLIQTREYPAYEVIRENDLSDQNENGYVRWYRWQHPESGQTLVQVQAFFIAGTALFTLTGTRDASSNEDLDSVLEHIIKSFRFLHK